MSKTTQKGVTVAVLGASPKKNRYSFKAVRKLQQQGYIPIPVHPHGHTVDGIPGVKSLDDIINPVDTLTIYVNPTISSQAKAQILRLHPRRVIFNPGTENDALAEDLKSAGIEVVNTCTLVLLQSGLF